MYINIIIIIFISGIIITFLITKKDRPTKTSTLLDHLPFTEGNHIANELKSNKYHKLNLIHFGDQCAPGIIINDILHIKKKQLFMLGIYNFNDIINYLTNDQLDQIYNLDFLNKKDNETIHILYNFRFNHDYKYDSSSNITNYDYVKKRFIEKINNNKEIYNLNNYNIFINFTDDINNLNINGFLALYEKKIKYYLFIFTNNNYKEFNKKHISVIKLKNSYVDWYEMDEKKKNVLYEEIYSKFINELNINKLYHNFPTKYSDCIGHFNRKD